MVKILTPHQLAGYAPTMRRMSTEQLIYLAGIVDGEGHIRCDLQGQAIARGVRARYYAKLTITNTSIELMDWLRALGTGRIYTTMLRPPHRTRYDWVVSAQEDVAYMLRSMLPYLVIKPAIARRVLDVISAH
jgi:hypothetical protein